MYEECFRTALNSLRRGHRAKSSNPNRIKRRLCTELVSLPARRAAGLGCMLCEMLVCVREHSIQIS